jgi:Uncharacterized conserved protein
MKNEILKGKKGWYFRIKADNGKILCHSETYTRRRNALKGLIIVLGLK